MRGKMKETRIMEDEGGSVRKERREGGGRRD